MAEAGPSSYRVSNCCIHAFQVVMRAKPKRGAHLDAGDLGVGEGHPHARTGSAPDARQSGLRRRRAGPAGGGAGGGGGRGDGLYAGCGVHRSGVRRLLCRCVLRHRAQLSQGVVRRSLANNNLVLS